MKLVQRASSFILFFTCIHYACSLEEVASWRYLSFENVSQVEYIPENVIFTGIQVTSTRCFLTMPRLLPGVPVTLATIPSTGGPYNEKELTPFPSLEAQNGKPGNCQALVSVFRSRLDPCGRLWVLDTGSIDAFGNFQQLCQPKLVVYNSATGQEMYRIEIPSDVLRQNSLLVTMALDRAGSSLLEFCSSQADDIFIYISDVLGAIIVYDHKNRAFWRREHQTLEPNPNNASISMLGECFYLEDGVLGMAVGILNTLHKGQDKVLFYQAFAGLMIYATPTSTLQHPSAAQFVAIPIKEKPSQGAGLAIDTFGRLIFSPILSMNIQAYNTEAQRTLILSQDNEKLQFVSDITHDTNHALWMISNKFQSFVNNNYRQDRPNLRILKIPRHDQFRFV